MSYLESFDLGDLDDLAEVGIKGDDYIPLLKEQSHFKPVFGFDYISLSGSSFCFDNPAISLTDYRSLLSKCKEISSLTYSDLSSESDKYLHRFHVVDKKKLEAHQLIKNSHISINGTQKRVPEIYQFGLYTDRSTNKAPRIAGFIGKWGIFYLLWFDLSHLIYPENYITD